MPTAATYQLHLVSAHTSLGHAVDAFIVLVGRWRSGRHDRLRAAITSAYAEVASLSFFEERELEELHLRCSPPHDRRYLTRLNQWISIREAYRLLEAHEAAAGFRYAWIYRTRTDLVYLTPSPFATAGLLERLEGSGGGAAVYVPASIDSPRATHTCLNDMLFACPRALCRPYFELLELFESPHCNASECGAGCGLVCAAARVTATSRGHASQPPRALPSPS